MRIRASFIVLVSLLPLPAWAEGPTAPPAAAHAAAESRTTEDVAVKDALRRTSATVDLRAAAATVAATAGPPAGTRTTVGTSRTSLAAIGATGADASMGAGVTRDTAGPRAEAPVVAPSTKPLAGPRALRRMDVGHVIASMRDGFGACYAESGTRATGAVVVRANTAGSGEVESVELVSYDGLPRGLAVCVADRVHAAKFHAPGGSGLAVVVPVQFSGG